MLSLVIPAYNEAKKIDRDLDACFSFLCQKSWYSEVLVVNDGSTDGTDQKVKSFLRRLGSNEKVSGKLISLERNRGKGHAVRRGVLESRGRVVAFLDAGLCVPLSCLDLGLQKLDEGFHYAIASRKLKASCILERQPWHRRWGSVGFAWVVKRIMGVDFVSDTQCGFKLFEGEAARKIFSELKCDGFMFDVESLLWARKLRLRGSEFPVPWSNDRDTRYHPLWGTFRNFCELASIRLRMRAL